VDLGCLVKGKHRPLHDCPPSPFPLRILAIVFADLVRRWDSSAPVRVLLGNNNICLVQDL
jgi:hypothetical protein